jgi:nickel-dependent lactate racemase
MNTLQKRAHQGNLSRDEVHTFVAHAVSHLHIESKRVLIIVPDSTRTMPMPLMFEILQAEIGARAAACDYLVALGTHQRMTDAQLSRSFGHPVNDGICDRARIFNHRWDLPDTFADIGVIPADEVAAISAGVLSEEIRVQINRLIFDYELVLICGPVFPHEVIGFSGGNKYLFPGIGTGEIIHQTHWLGALLGSYNIMGTFDTPVRRLVDLAAEKVSVPVACFALALQEANIAGIYFGSAREAWRLAAEHSSQIHIEWVDRPFQRVLAVIPEMYTDLWTGAKGMYKSDPAIADGGEVILYAPHINEVSYSHGAILERLGYHCAEYFLKQQKRFAGLPRGLLAHSVHLYGQGTYDPSSGVEQPRIRVTLATGISEQRCRSLNLGNLDARSIRLEDWRGREREGVKLIPHAGERLYRLNQQRNALTSEPETATAV